MESFYLGLAGSLVGGVFLSATISILFYIEKRQAAKTSTQLVNDLKTMYYNKINGQSNTVLKSKTKMN